MVVDDNFEVLVGSQVTGKIDAYLNPSNVGAGLRYNDAGPLDVAIPIKAFENKRLNPASTCAALRQFMAVSYQGNIIEAGPIWKQAYDPKKEVMKLTGAGLWTLLDAVKALPWYAMAVGVSPTTLTLNVVNKALGSIAREFVRIAVYTNPKNPGLPIVLPEIIPDINERNPPGYSLPWLGDLLRNLTGVKGGPDIRFRAERRPDDNRYVQWVMSHGTRENPLLTQHGPDWIWDATVPHSTIGDFGWQQDATRMAARAWQPGAGSEQEMKLKWADDTTLIETAGYPWTEVDIAMKDIEDEDLLQEYADAGISAARFPMETWNTTVRADETPKLGEFLPGDWSKLIIPDDHPIIPGEHRARIMSVDVDGTRDVKVVYAPIQGRP